MLAVRCVPAAANSSTRHSLSFGVRRAGVHFLLHLCMMANGLSVCAEARSAALSCLIGMNCLLKGNEGPVLLMLIARLTTRLQRTRSQVGETMLYANAVFQRPQKRARTRPCTRPLKKKCAVPQGVLPQMSTEHPRLEAGKPLTGDPQSQQLCRPQV